MVTMISVIGKESQIPLIPISQERQTAAGSIRNSPRAREMTCAGSAWSVAAKYIARMILKPANGMAVKYNFRPVTAICCSCIFFPLLKILTIGYAIWKKRR